MGACKSQKGTEVDKRIEKALNKLLSGQFESVYEAARQNDVFHSTLLRRINSGKSTVESYKSQQILMILEENWLAKCITHLAVVGHPPKHTFIHKRAEQIRSHQNDHSNLDFSIGDLWVQRFIY